MVLKRTVSATREFSEKENEKNSNDRMRSGPKSTSVGAAVFGGALIVLFTALGSQPLFTVFARFLPTKTEKVSVIDRDLRKNYGGFAFRGMSNNGTTHVVTVERTDGSRRAIFCQKEIYNRVSTGREIDLESSSFLGVPVAVHIWSVKAEAGSLIPKGGILEELLKPTGERSHTSDQGERVPVSGAGTWSLIVVWLLFCWIAGFIVIRLPGRNRAVWIARIAGIATGLLAGALWATT